MREAVGVVRMKTVSAIHAIHWDDLGRIDGWHQFVVLPGPVDHDQCLRDAGFQDFADSNARWDAELADIVSKIVGVLRAFGDPVVREALAGARAHGVFQRIRGWLSRSTSEPDRTLIERLVEAATSDQVPGCVVEFGEGGAARLCVGDGHPIFWLRVPLGSGGVERVIEAVAGGRSVHQTPLHWQRLQPRELALKT